MTDRRLLAFCLGNGLVVVFFYGTWLLSWWIPTIDRLQDNITDTQWLAAWFVGFFVASFIPLSAAGKKVSVVQSAGCAFLFTVLLICLMGVSIPILGLLLPQEFR
jgi:hypothetical protein